MSVQNTVRRKTVPQIRNSKNNTPVVCLTAYHAHTARLVDPYVDLLLVGDSLGMVMHGMENTLGVSLELMILHGKAVMRSEEHTSELQSLTNLVCRLLLEKKKKISSIHY